MLSIPKALVLTEGQAEKARAFYKKVTSLSPSTTEEECSPMSRIIFSVQDTGLITLLSARDERTGLTESLLTEEDLDNV